MLRRILILDGAIVVLLVFGVLKLKEEWQAFGPLHNVAAIEARPQAFPSLAVPASSAASAGGGDWNEIPTRNPFSFDRSDVDTVVAEAEPPRPTAGPKPVFFGAIILDKDHRYAMVAPSPAVKSKEMKVGDVINGWTIVELAQKSMVIESNGVKETVIMNDPMVQIPRQTVRAAASAPTTTIVAPSGQPSNSAAVTAAPRNPGAAAPAAPVSAGPIRNAAELFGVRTAQ